MQHGFCMTINLLYKWIIPKFPFSILDSQYKRGRRANYLSKYTTPLRDL